MLKKIKSFLKNQYLERLLDSILILLATSALTFLFVRIDLTIENIDLLKVILIFGLGIAVLSWQRIYYMLGYLGAVVLLGLGIFYFQVFPSSLEIGSLYTLIILPLLWGTLCALLLLRSWFSRERMLLKIIGLITILGIASNGMAVLPESPLNLTLSSPIQIKSGDPLADLRLNPAIFPETLEREKKRLGLDQPLHKQYFLWLENVIVRGEFGITQQGERVIDAVKAPLRNTILLNIIVISLSWLIAVPLGVLAAINKGKWLDDALLSLSSLSLTIPSFLLSILVLSFALRFGIGQIGGLTSVNFSDLGLLGQISDIMQHLLLPVFVLTFVGIGMLIRQMRGNLLDVLNDEYIRAGKARGLSDFIMLWRHAVPNAINPLITLLGFEFANLISGAALTEMVLSYPGIGALTLEAAKRMDINLIMFMLILGTFMLLLGNLLADMLLRKVDPRTRLEE